MEEQFVVSQCTIMFLLIIENLYPSLAHKLVNLIADDDTQSQTTTVKYTHSVGSSSSLQRSSKTLNTSRNLISFELDTLLTDLIKPVVDLISTTFNLKAQSKTKMLQTVNSLVASHDSSHRENIFDAIKHVANKISVFLIVFVLFFFDSEGNF